MGKLYRRFYEGKGHNWSLPSDISLKEGYQVVDRDLRIPIKIEFQEGDRDFPSCWWITLRSRRDLEKLWEKDGLL